MSAFLHWFFSVLLSPLWALLLHPWWRRHQTDTWVIGGHRGRLYADNAGEVERAARALGRSTIFLANPPLVAELRAQGITALRRNSWAARRAISQARVLIYSHGEDDLDFCASLLRGRSTLRIYLGHSLAMMKGGGVCDPSWNDGGPLMRAGRRWLLTDSDFILAASEEEAKTLRKSYPKPRVVLGGGAHLSAWERARVEPPKKRIYWFPTFRDHKAGNLRLRQVISEVVSNPALEKWLREANYEMFIGTHVNLSRHAPLELKPPFFARSPGNIVKDVAASEVFISDYSGIVFDFLFLERPQIHFTFDLEDYLKRRVLVTPHENMPFGLHVKSVRALCDAITSEAFRDPALKVAARAAKERCLPPADGDFGERSVHTIDTLLETWPDER